MNTQIIFPQIAVLRPYIKYFWTMQAQSQGVETVIPPEPTHDIIFSFADGTVWKSHATEHVFKGGYLSGVRKTPYIIAPLGVVDYLAVRLTPLGLYRLMGGGIRDLVGQPLDLGEVNRPLMEIYQRLGDEHIHEKRIPILEQSLGDYLMHHARDAEHDFKSMGGLIHLLHQSKGQGDIRSLGEQTGLYYKKMERLFARYMGITPKFYARLLKFNYGLELLIQDQVQDWVDITYAAGYFDQAHYIREFEYFMGVSPARYALTRHSTAEMQSIYDRV
jgi:AraC-like DNA-binding protein